MKFSIATLLLLAVIATGAGRRPAPTPSASPTPDVSVLPIAQGKVKFEPVQYYSTPAQRVKIVHAAVKLNETVQSQCFRDFMLKQKFEETNGRNTLQVVDHLQSLTGTVAVKMYYQCQGIWPCTSAVAYRNIGSMEIHLNSATFGNWLSDCEWASTLAHESLGHTLGEYGHSMKWTRKREDTVPYVMGGRKKVYGGDAFEACCK